MSDNDRLFTYLRHLGVEPSIETFQHRKRMQKLIYLMQEFGVDLNYGFTWYLHGPYSPDLTQDLFDVLERHIHTEPIGLSNQEQKNLDNLRAFLGDDITSTHKLELLASLYYLKQVNEQCHASKAEIISILKAKKPQFTDDEIESAWAKLQNLNN